MDHTPEHQEGTGGGPGLFQRLVSRPWGLNEQHRLSLSLTTGAQMREGEVVERDVERGEPEGGRDPNGSVALSAQRVRGERSNMSIDIQQAILTLETALPFVLMLLLIFLFKHMMVIGTFAWATLVLHQTNAVLIQAGAHDEGFGRVKAAIAGGFLLVNALCIMMYVPQGYSMFDILKVYGRLVGMTLTTTLLTIMTADASLRLLTGSIKAFVIARTKMDSPDAQRQRGVLLSVVDGFSGVVRAIVVPFIPWCSFFFQAEISTVGAMFCCFVYGVLKMRDVWKRTRMAMIAVREYRSSVLVGKRTSKVAVQCSICHEDCRQPLELPCSHVFCEECIGEWLERNSTCPMCRAVVSRALGLRKNGSTTLFCIWQ